MSAAVSQTPKQKRRREEDALQRSVVELLQYLENQKRLTYFAVPNGGYRSKTEAAILKGLGVRAGVADLIIIGPLGKVYALELKSRNGETSPEQDEFAERVCRLGGEFAIERDLDGVNLQLKAWGLT